MSAPIRSALLSLALLGAAAGLGCDSIGEAVMDPCSSNRKALQLAENKISGLRARNVDRQKPVYRLAVADLRHTQQVLVDCEAVYGDGI
jgi:hypothetical protein